MSVEMRGALLSRTSRAGLAPLAPRLLAVCIDAFAVVLVLQLAALVAYAASDGRVQLRNAPFGTTRCAPAAVPGQAVQPAGMQMCRSVLLGRPYASDFREGVSLRAQELGVASGPVDAKGRLIRPFDLGWLFAPLFALMRAALERAGLSSPGRGWTRTRLVTTDDAALDGPRLLRRYVALVGPFMAFSLVAEFAPLAGAWAWALSGLATILVLWTYGLMALDILRARPPWHDRLADTRVIRREEKAT